METLSEMLETVRLLVTHELAIGELYEAYARRFPDQAELWRGLAAEEREHAEWLDAMGHRVEAGELAFDARRFKAPAVRSALKYLKRRQEEAAAGGVTRREALGTALDIEQALLENAYYRAIAGDPVDLRVVLDTLSAGTREHLARVREALDAVRDD